MRLNFARIVDFGHKSAQQRKFIFMMIDNAAYHPAPN